jgi:uncharacterized cysteine cluster protein YcgN (CxxCxxCC family)
MRVELLNGQEVSVDMTREKKCNKCGKVCYWALADSGRYILVEEIRFEEFVPHFGRCRRVKES